MRWRATCAGSSAMYRRSPMGRPTEKIGYPAIVENAAEGFAVFFPDRPGCTTAGATVQDAALNAEEALQAHIDLSVEHVDLSMEQGDAIQGPSAVDRTAVDPAVVEVARLLVLTEPLRRRVTLC